MEVAMIVFSILVSVTVLVVAFKSKKMGSLFTSPYDEDFKEFSEELDRFKEADFGLIRNILNDNAILSKEPIMVRLEIDKCDEYPDGADSKTCRVKIGSKRFVLLFQDDTVIVFQNKLDQINPFDILHAFRIMRLTGMGHWFKTINKVCLSRHESSKSVEVDSNKENHACTDNLFLKNLENQHREKKRQAREAATTPDTTVPVIIHHLQTQTYDSYKPSPSVSVSKPSGGSNSDDSSPSSSSSSDSSSSSSD